MELYFPCSDMKKVDCLPVVVEMLTINHSACSVAALRQLVLLTYQTCFDLVHVFILFKYISTVILHNKYSLSTHDFKRVFNPGSLLLEPCIVDHRFTNRLDVATFICKKLKTRFIILGRISKNVLKQIKWEI